MQFHRITIFNLGAAIILSLCYYSRIDFYLHAKTTMGTVLGSVDLHSGRYNNSSYDEVQFKVDTTEYYFKAQTILHYDQFSKVPVIYNPQNPSDAKVFTLIGFWSMPFAWALIPLFIFYAVIFSFWGKNDVIKMS